MSIGRDPPIEVKVTAIVVSKTLTNNIVESRAADLRVTNRATVELNVGKAVMLDWCVGLVKSGSTEVVFQSLTTKNVNLYILSNA